jgi:hypothetical protein
MFIIDDIIKAKGAKSAGKAAAAAEEKGIAFQRESRDLALGYQKPYRDAGYNALSALMDMAGLSRAGMGSKSISSDGTPSNQPGSRGTAPPRFQTGWAKLGPQPAQIAGSPSAVGPSDVPDISAMPAYDWQKNDPGYAFRLNEGQRSMEQLYRSAGLLNSGAALKGAIRYGQDYASNEYDKSWARLAAIAGFGANVSSAGSSIIGNTANAVQQGYSNIGQANAAAKIGAANQWAGVVNDIFSIGSMAFGGGGGASGGGVVRRYG